MRQIGLAFLAYHENHGSFPPAYVPDEEGRPAHSCGVLLLPYVCMQEIYRSYDFSEPWNGPNNRRLAEYMPDIYGCPDQRDELADGMTTYVAMLSDETTWTATGTRRIQDTTTTWSDALLLVEAPDAVPWMEPRDLSIDDFVGHQDVRNLSPIRCPRHVEGYFSYTCGLNALYMDNGLKPATDDGSEMRSVLQSAILHPIP